MSKSEYIAKESPYSWSCGDFGVLMLLMYHRKIAFERSFCGSDRTIPAKCNGLQRIMRTIKGSKNIERQ